MVYPRCRRRSSDRNPGRSRFGIPRGRRRQTQGARRSEKEVGGEVAFGAGGMSTGEAAVRISGIKLMKAVNVRRVEEGPVRRALLWRAIGCTASEKEH